MAEKNMTIGSASTAVNVKINGTLNLLSTVTIANTGAATATVGGQTVGCAARWYTPLGVKPKHGMMITIIIPETGKTSGQWLNITSSAADTDCHPIVYNATTRHTSHYPVGTPVTLVYDSTATLSAFPHASTATAAASTGVWKTMGSYDSTDPRIQIYTQTSDYTGQYPLIVSRTASSGLSTANGGTTKVYGLAIPSTAMPTMNGATGAITAPGGFIGPIQGLASTAELLKTGRTFQVDLTSTSASSAFNGSANITDIGVSGILPVTSGGTGNSSFVGGRLVWSESATKIKDGYHFASSTSVAINSTSNPDPYNFYVDGKSYLGSANLDKLSFGNVETIGSDLKPIYWNNGVPTAGAQTVGSTSTPIYLDNGTITAGLDYADAFVSVSQNNGLWTFTKVDGTTSTARQSITGAGSANTLAYYSSADTIESILNSKVDGSKISIGSTTNPSETVGINGSLEVTEKIVLTNTYGTAPNTTSGWTIEHSGGTLNIY